MKRTSILKNVIAGTSILLFSVLISSCKKDDIDESGSANLIVVNAATGSSAQSFFLADKPVVSGGLNFGDSKGYIATNSGKNLQAAFRNEGTETAYASDDIDLTHGRNYTIFLAGEGQSARVRLYEDDMTAPASGQAKVRFIHLSDAAPANVDIRRASGDNLVVNLARNASSNYVSLSPGLLSLQVYGTGQTTSLGNFDLSAFEAGKIYTVYVTGSNAGNISVKQITHN
jgi:hypothetical protein